MVFQGTFQSKLKHGKGITEGNNQKIIAYYENDIKNGPYEIINKDNSYY